MPRSLDCRLVKMFETGERVFLVSAGSQQIGYFVTPHEIFISVRDPFMVEKLELISEPVRNFLVTRVEPYQKVDKLKYGIATSYLLRVLRMAGINTVVVDGAEHKWTWERVKIQPSYFYVPKCQKYVDVDLKCPKCCGWLLKPHGDPLLGVPAEVIASLPAHVKQKLGKMVVQLPETGKTLEVYYSTLSPCPFSDPVTLKCRLPMDQWCIKCWFYPGVVARVANGTLVLSRNLRACSEDAKMKLVKSAPPTVVSKVTEKVKIDLNREIKFWQRLKELTGSSKVDLIIDALERGL